MVKKHNDCIDLAVRPTLTYGKKSGFGDLSTPDLGVCPSPESMCFFFHPFLSVTVTTLKMPIGGDEERDKEKERKSSESNRLFEMDIRKCKWKEEI